MSSLAHGMRVNYSQKAFVFVIHLSSERAGELVYRLSKCQAMGSLQNVPFRAICLKGRCQLSAIRGAVRRVGRRNYSHLTHRRDTWGMTSSSFSNTQKMDSSCSGSAKEEERKQLHSRAKARDLDGDECISPPEQEFRRQQKSPVLYTIDKSHYL